ncbi:MAG TPA: hypothetical protein VFS64_07155 [Solirubrobacterales bacterium]|nr:hypothetical protein [Solirubrobacterales bacterium]
MSDLGVQIQSMLEEEAGQALSAGWAELRESDNVVGLTFHLEPMTIGAAPLEVHFDSDELLVCYPGRNNMVVEFFSEDPEEIERQVRALAVAVVSASYGERVKEGTTEVEAEWPGPDGPQRASRKVVQVPGAEAVAWRAVEYEAYW